MTQIELLELLRTDTLAWNRAMLAARMTAWFRPDLRGSDLRDSDLRGANLSDSNLSGANLSGANLRGANLSDSDLSDSNLRGANLSDSNLSDSDLSGSNLSDSGVALGAIEHVKLDFWSVLDNAPGEVAALRGALVDGLVDGSLYGDADRPPSVQCGCLVGTLRKTAVAHGVVIDLPERPWSHAECWFMPISKGDTPESDNEGGFRNRTAVTWIDAWDARNALIIGTFAVPA